MITRLYPAASTITNPENAAVNRPLQQGPEEEAFEIFTRYQGYLGSQDAALIAVALKQFLALQKKYPDTVGCRKFRAEITRFAVQISKEVLAFQQVGTASLQRPMALVGVNVLQDLRAAIDAPVIETTVAALNAAENPESFKAIQVKLQRKMEDFFRVGMLLQVATPFDMNDSVVFQTLGKIPEALTAPLFSGKDSLASTILQKCLFENAPDDFLGRGHIFANFIFVAGLQPETFNPPRLISEARVAYGGALAALQKNAAGNVGVRGQITQIELEYAGFCLKVGAFEDLPGLIQDISAHGSDADSKQLNEIILKLNGYEKLNRDPLANTIAPWVFLLAAKIKNGEIKMDGPLQKIIDATRPALKQLFAADPDQVTGCLLRLKPFFQTIQDEAVGKMSAEFFKSLVTELKTESKDEKAKAKYDEALKFMGSPEDEKENGK